MVFTFNIHPPLKQWYFKLTRFVFVSWALASSCILTLFGSHILYTTYRKKLYQLSLLLSILSVLRLISPLFVAQQMRDKLKKTFYLLWYTLGSLINLTYFIFTATALWFVYIEKGCHKDMSRNRVTFLPVEHTNTVKVLYHSSNIDWNDHLKEKYDRDFRTIPLDLQVSDGKRLCGQHVCQAYNTRYEVDHLIWLFLYIGYISVADFVINIFHTLQIFQEYKELCQSLHPSEIDIPETHALDPIEEPLQQPKQRCSIPEIQSEELGNEETAKQPKNQTKLLGPEVSETEF